MTKRHDRARRPAKTTDAIENAIAREIRRAYAPAPRPQRRRRLTAKSLRKGQSTWSFRAHDQHGERQTITIPFAEYPTMRAALKRANEIAAELNPESKPASPTFAAYVERQYFDEVLPSLGEDTQRAARSVLRKHAIPRFVDARLHQVAARLQKWIDDQHGAGVVVSTIEHRVAVVKAVLTAAKNTHELDVGRMPTLRWPTSNRTRRTHAAITFSAAEEQQIVAAAHGAERAAYLLGLELGLRPSEITGLSWTNMDLDGRVLTVAQQSRRGRVVAPKTAGSHATLAIPDALLAELRTLRPLVPDATFLLASPDRPEEPMRTAQLRSRLATQCEALKLPNKGLHALRRRFADALLEAGTPLHIIQAALRHSTMQTTIKYLSHAQRPEVEAAIRAAGERFRAGDRDTVVVELATRRRRQPSRPRKQNAHELPRLD